MFLYGNSLAYRAIGLRFAGLFAVAGALILARGVEADAAPLRGRLVAFVSTSDTFRPGSPAVQYTVRSGNAQAQFSLPRGKGSGELSLPKPWIEITATWRGQTIKKTFDTVIRDDLRLAIIVSVRYNEETGKIRFHRQQ